MLGKVIVSELRVTKLTGTVQWDDGTNFTGYAKFELVMPTDALAQEWDVVFQAPGSSMTPVELPLWSVIPINEGVFNTSVGLLYNADLVPHNTKYQATYYDQTLKKIAGPTATFTVTTAETTPLVPTLSAPIAPA